MNIFSLKVFTLDKPIELVGEDDVPVCRYDDEGRCSIVSKTLDLYKPDSIIKIFKEKSTVKV